MNKGEELLAQVLEECLEEDLSFVPPEREIARKHKFSAKFEEEMEKILEHSSEQIKKQEIRKHFHPRYGQLAACVLLFCVCGWLFWSLVGPMSGKNAAAIPEAAYEESAAAMEEESAKTTEEESAAVTEEAPAAEPAEGSAEDIPEVAENKEENPLDTGVLNAGERLWCGQTVSYAKQQDVPETLENVTTLVNCPVLAEDDSILYLTIGNVSEEPVEYLDEYELEVKLEDGWYVIPPAAAGEKVWKELEAGMAVDLEIDLAEYQLDYGAQLYRLIVYVDQKAVSAEFTFEEVFSEKMKKQEEETSRE